MNIAFVLVHYRISHLKKRQIITSVAEEVPAEISKIVDKEVSLLLGNKILPAIMYGVGSANKFG